MDPVRALADLTEISSQIEAAVLLDRDGGLIGSTIAGEARSRRLAETAWALLAAAEQARGGSEPLVQLEAATLGGSVFVVRDAEHVIAATTSAEPTVGLVFYDLKSCLRSAAAETQPLASQPRRRRAGPVGAEADGAP